MEIDVTSLVADRDMFDFFASQAERGKNAGPETWANAQTEAAERPILTEDQLPKFRNYAREFGAWDDDEINGWSATECNALLIQMVAGDVREARSLHPGDDVAEIDWPSFEADDNASGRLFKADDGRVFYYVGT